MIIPEYNCANAHEKNYWYRNSLCPGANWSRIRRSQNTYASPNCSKDSKNGGNSRNQIYEFLPDPGPRLEVLEIACRKDNDARITEEVSYIVSSRQSKPYGLPKCHFLYIYNQIRHGLPKRITHRSDHFSVRASNPSRKLGLHLFLLTLYWEVPRTTLPMSHISENHAAASS